MGDVLDKFMIGAEEKLDNPAEVEAMVQKAEELADQFLKSVEPALQMQVEMDSKGDTNSSEQPSEVEKYQAAVQNFDFRGARGTEAELFGCLGLGL